MINYFQKFPEKMKTELRTLTVLDDGDEDSLPSGVYAFMEFYCPDIRCNCQRVVIKVFHSAAHAKPSELATINYSWNPKKALGREILKLLKMKNPFLDPLHRQSRFAKELLKFWTDMVTSDQPYAARLQRHYEELRGAVGDTAAAAGLAKPGPRQQVRSLSNQERRQRNLNWEAAKRLRAREA